MTPIRRIFADINMKIRFYRFKSVSSVCHFSKLVPITDSHVLFYDQFVFEQ